MKTPLPISNNSIRNLTTHRRASVGKRIMRRLGPTKLLAVSFAWLLFGSVITRASDPVGIYALVDKVVLEPNETSPERVQIWGAFAIAEGYGYTYKQPERGYLYYKLNPDKANLCRNEWSDLKAVAGTGQIVTFGSRHQEKGALRKRDSKPEKPDAYPIAMGVGKAREDKSYAPVKALLALREAKPKTKGEPPNSKN